MRTYFFIVGTISVLSFLVLGCFYPESLWIFLIIGPLVLLGLYDSFQTKHTILRNFPVIGHFRYMFESISPEIKQYFVERNTDGKPISKNIRDIIYQRSKNVNDTHPFGTQLELNNSDYEGLRHSIYPVEVAELPPRVLFGGADCRKPYSASILNISAMSFGALSSNAILALSRGAKKGNFYHNTGEGGLSHYHLDGGADIVWQIGTGYFGCRTREGNFDEEMFKQKSSHEQVKMIELKLSQGAKPGHGGILPAPKNSPEIAKIRGVEPYTTVISPLGHTAFHDAKGLLEFIQKLRDLSDGKPVGFKLCLGKPEEFVEICNQMVSTGIKPDFITVDGAEGGTGAAPLEYSDSVGIPLEPALIFVHSTLIKFNLRKEIRIIASGKVYDGISILKMMTLGADTCNSARGFMMSIGCIQALRCNTGKCPTGITTQNPKLVKGLVVEDKYIRAYNYHRNTVKAVMELMASCGIRNLDEINDKLFIKGDEFVELENKYYPDSLKLH